MQLRLMELGYNRRTYQLDTRWLTSVKCNIGEIDPGDRYGDRFICLQLRDSRIQSAYERNVPVDWSDLQLFQVVAIEYIIELSVFAPHRVVPAPWPALHNIRFYSSCGQICAPCCAIRRVLYTIVRTDVEISRLASKHGYKSQPRQPKTYRRQFR